MGLLENAESCVIVYPGQGGQRAGMGRRVIEHSETKIQDVFDTAERVTGVDIRRICLEGVDSRGSSLDTYGQVGVVSILLAERLRVAAQLEQVDISGVSGLSIGLWPAYVDAGVLSVKNCLSLVHKREVETLKTRRGKMVRVSNVSVDQMQQIRSEFGLEVAVKYSETELVLVGMAEEVESFAQAAQSYRPIILPITTGYHWEGQFAAKSSFAQYVDPVLFNDAHYRVILNSNGSWETSSASLRQEIIDQITSPADWQAVQIAIQSLRPSYVFEVCDQLQLSVLNRKVFKELNLEYRSSHNVAG